jgi:DNA-binding CsgD family transcriptional regulator
MVCSPVRQGPAGNIIVDVALIERDRELAMIQERLTDASQGRGATLRVEGAAGIGKTALLAAARRRADSLGVRTLAAVGGELEQDLPFAIVRQLFEPSVRSVPVAGLDELLSGAAGLAAPVFGPHLTAVSAADPASMSSIVHGLYWVCSNLAERGPLVLAVDDVHWADESSLRFVSHLARRISDLPVLLLLSGRPQPPGASLDRALSGTGPDVITLRPLSEHAVGHLVREVMSQDADDVFCRACATASGGNPFLLTEALTSLRAEQVPPVAAEATRVGTLRPETIAQAVLTRVARLGPEAVQLARALAVLGPVNELRHAAALAGLRLARAAEIGVALAREDILTSTRPIQFAHPLVRTAIYTDGGELRRAADHKRAALLLDADGVPSAQLVPHLLAAEPESDPRVVGWLRAAASSALALGAPEPAATYLRRALTEPPSASERLPILADLGRALGRANRPAEAIGAFRAAEDLAHDPKARVELAMELAAFMVQTGRSADAMESFERARRAMRNGDAEFLRHPHGGFVMASFLAMEPPRIWIGRLERILREAPGDSDTHRLITAVLAFASAATGDRSASETDRLALRAAEGPLPVRDRWMLVNLSSAALAIAGRPHAAIELLDHGIDTAQRLGDVAEFRYLSVLRSHTAFEAGRLLEAEADARGALALHDTENTQEIQLAAAVLIEALVERGDLSEAQTLLAERGLEKDYSVSMLIDHVVLLARGRLRLRQNRPREALDDLRNCGGTLVAAGYLNPAFAQWRPVAALAHLALGETSAAHELAAEDLDLALGFAAPHAVGIALHALGMTETATESIRHLEESVAVLQDSGAALAHARSLIDYGAALRRTGQRTKALEPLRHGLDLAARCAAQPLTARANEELIAAGARPRRVMLTGPDALTASELRVARLATNGATNREIAQTLFVSRRTVEIHLTNAYRKLEIDSRHQLKTALA